MEKTWNTHESQLAQTTDEPNVGQLHLDNYSYITITFEINQWTAITVTAITRPDCNQLQLITTPIVIDPCLPRTSLSPIADRTEVKQPYIAVKGAM